MSINKYRCETCEHLSTSRYPAGSGFCLKSKRGYLMDSQTNISLMEFVADVGCASHSSITKITTNVVPTGD